METVDINNIEDNLCQLLKFLNMSDEYKHFKFHHMGIASNSVDESFEDYQMISYEKGDYYIDENLGVKGLFAISQTKPTLEILENLPNCHSLDIYLKNFITTFHLAYIVDNFQYCCDLIVNKMGGKIISDIKDSAYFKGKCCYVLTPDRYTLELIEDKR